MSVDATSEGIVLGRYRLGPAIGRGATSVVRRARDLATGEDVAVKAVPTELDLGARVRAEVRAAGRLDHPGIVALRDWGEDRDFLYLVWELVEGPSLREVLREGVDATRIVRIGADVLAALAHAHAQGVVHRDVKPANVLIGRGGRTLLSDFGVARLSGESGLTLTGSVVGTVAYMAPEQARGEAVGPAADVYAACLVVYEGLTGANPVAAASPAVTARRAASGAVPPLVRARPDLPPRICAAIDAGLRHDPAGRPAAGELADALAGAVAGVWSRRGRGARMLPALASAAGGGALAAVALHTADGALADWQSPASRAAAIAVAALLFAWRPRAAALTAVAAGAVLVGTVSPGAAIVLGALAAVVLLAGLPAGRLTLLPAAGPLLFALGLGPLLAAVAGLVPGWRARLWTAVAGTVATLAWQVSAGADALMAGGGQVAPGVADLRDVASPIAAARRLWEPLAARPEALVQAAILVAGALCVPLVRRARPGTARSLAAAAWVVAVAGAMVAVAATGAEALGAVAPAALVVVAWALRPWRIVTRRGPSRASATLRSPTA